MEEIALGFITGDAEEEVVESVVAEEEEKEEDIPQFSYLTRELCIQPTNERTRTQKLSKERQEELRRIQEENERRLLEARNQKLFEEKERLRKQLEDEEALRRRLEREDAEEREELAGISGQFGTLLSSLISDSSKFCLALTEENLTPVQMRIFFKAFARNTSVKTLSLHRKRLEAGDIEPLLESLKVNASLEKLELDENQISGSALVTLAACLRVNDSLRSLSLNDNPVFASADSAGLAAFCDALRQNSCLNYLSLARTGLTQRALDSLAQVVEENPSLIHIDVEFNSGLSPESLVRLQASLASNLAAYQADRQSEFLQRRVLKLAEADRLDHTLRYAASTQLVKDIERLCAENYLSRMRLYQDEIQKIEELDRRKARALEKEALARASKKKRRPKTTK